MSKIIMHSLKFIIVQQSDVVKAGMKSEMQSCEMRLFWKHLDLGLFWLFGFYFCFWWFFPYFFVEIPK